MRQNAHSMIEKLRVSLKMCGPWETARQLLPAFAKSKYDKEGVEFDNKYGVETAVTVSSQHLGIDGESGKHAREYTPTVVRTFAFMMNSIDIAFEDFCFVDVGSGKGRVLLMASDYPFGRMVGVEASRQLHEIAQKNLSTYSSSKRKCDQVQLLLADAVDFEMPRENTVFYMCNPFGPPILRQFLANLHVSLRQHPRRIFLIYDYPWYVFDTLIQASFLRLVADFQAIDPTYRWCLFEAQN